jgi:hypothetical protein
MSICAAMDWEVQSENESLFKRLDQKMAGQSRRL